MARCAPPAEAPGQPAGQPACHHVSLLRCHRGWGVVKAIAQTAARGLRGCPRPLTCSSGIEPLALGHPRARSLKSRRDVQRSLGLAVPPLQGCTGRRSHWHGRCAAEWRSWRTMHPPPAPNMSCHTLRRRSDLHAARHCPCAHPCARAPPVPSAGRRSHKSAQSRKGSSRMLASRNAARRYMSAVRLPCRLEMPPHAPRRPRLLTPGRWPARRSRARRAPTLLPRLC